MLSETLADCSVPDAATELLAASPPSGSGERTAPITPVSPYHAARWARDRHVEELENRVRYLRALVFILAAVSAIAVQGAVALARQSRIVPYLVEVDRLGQPRAFGRVEDMPVPEERLIRGEVRRFIDAMRGVVSDPVAQNQMIDRGYAYTRGPGRTYVDAYFSAPRNNPHLLSRELIRLVQVRSVRRVAGSESTWEVEWDEYEVPVRGGQAMVRPWHGTLRTAVVPPADEQQLIDNPLGLYVTDVSWAPLNDGAAVNLQDVRGLMDAAASERLRDAQRAPQGAPAAMPPKETR
ncbi:MAG: virB8 family protein [Gemmatimonadetes bacterium]|nr:virB8 family protein [Gemmatimonadota bacterium]